MSELSTLESLDRDGAIEDAAAKVDPVTRGSFLRRAGIGVGAVMGGGALMGALPSVAGAVAASDVAILNFALTLEYLEAAFYAEAVSKGALNGEVKAFARVVRNHEAAHVAFLKGALGKAAVKKPKFDFRGTTSDQNTFLQTAITLEDTGVAAYLGQVGRIKSKKILGAAGSILPVEARHAAWARDIAGRGGAPLPAPVAFQGAKTKGQILAAVKGTKFIVG